MSTRQASAKRRVDAVQAPVQRVLMVCMGNICRSPTAEAVLRHRLQRAGLSGIEVDSAGTHAGHIGHQPDDRAIAHAGRRGYELAHLRARRVRGDDFEAFDLVVAMDDDNLESLQQICPPEAAHKLVLLLDFAPQADQPQVPDPYYGGPAGFERVLDLVELGCDGLLQYLQSQQGRQGLPEAL
ncbi:MAG: low molecular weight phosphotyrosine protein phosphatase [Burkholderiales bacterium]|nr:low molecular weight phosphotyrosine protein phosphatase [Burkholderiales bacterium]